MIKGVPREWWMATLLVAAPFYGIFANIFIALIVGALMWLYGYVRAKSDPEFFAVRLMKWRQLQKTKGNYNGNEYLP